MDMPRYRSHKTVSALEIKTAFRRDDDGILLTFTNDYPSFVIAGSIVARYMPVEGDFFLKYEDGYISISPRKAFLDGYTPDGAHAAAVVEMAARVAHEVNRAYCASIGDNSQPAWADAPQWQRESAISGVKFTLASPTATPERSHESWLAEKTADGWKYGPVKNPEAKEHPCFVPYAELPAAQRVKDYLFLAVVRALAA